MPSFKYFPSEVSHFEVNRLFGWPKLYIPRSLNWMKCICSRMAQTNSPLLQGKQSTDNLEFKHESFCLLLLVLFPSFHYKCSALGFRTLGCPRVWVTTKEKMAMKFGCTRLFCCTPQMFRQTKRRWQGVNVQQKLQGKFTAQLEHFHCGIFMYAVFAPSWSGRIAAVAWRIGAATAVLPAIRNCFGSGV